MKVPKMIRKRKVSHGNVPTKELDWHIGAYLPDETTGRITPKQAKRMRLKSNKMRNTV